MLSKNYNYLLNGATASKYNSDLWFRYLRKMITKDGIKLSADDIQELTSSNQLIMYQKATLKEAVKIDSAVYKRVISQDENYVPRHLKLALKRIKEKQNEKLY